MNLNELKDEIHGLTFTVTAEDVKRHDSEYKGEKGFANKSSYSNRANVDSEYLEEYLAEKFPEEVLEKITDKPLKFYSDILLKSGNYKIDFKEIAGDFFNPQHDVERYLKAFANGQLTHFCFYRTNRERGNNNIPLIIEANTELTVEFLCIVDPHTLFSCKSTKYGTIPIQSIIQTCKNSIAKDCII